LVLPPTPAEDGNDLIKRAHIYPASKHPEMRQIKQYYLEFI
jgi:hypothetical protein